jgi:hypothetical protein
MLMEIQHENVDTHKNCYLDSHKLQFALIAELWSHKLLNSFPISQVDKVAY